MSFLRVRLVVFLCCHALALGQHSEIRREIAGVVKDPTGAIVPDATVVVISQEERTVGTTATSREGSFRVSGLPADPCRLEIRRKGFKLFTLQVLPAIHAPPILAVLAIADLSQVVEVTESPAAQLTTDPAENRDAATVDDNLLERLPVFDQDYVSAVSGFLDQGATGNMGTTIVVDGLEQKNAGVTASAVQSVKINNDPYSAEYSRPGRGRIEITTKTSDPVYHGTLNVIYRDYHLDARNAFASTRPPEQRQLFEGVLTGPLYRLNRTFFLFSADYQKDDIQSVVVAQLATGRLQENVPSPILAKDLAARVSHDFSDSHTMTLQFTYEGTSSKNQLLSGQNQNLAQGGGGNSQTRAYGGFVLPEAGVNVSGIERHLTYSDRLILNPNLINQLQVMYERNRNANASTTEQPQIVVQNAFVGGGAQATQLGTENNIDIRDVISWTHKSHSVSAGIAMPNMSRRALNDYSDRLGSFSFYSLQDYSAGTPYSFTAQQGPVHFVYWQQEVGGFVQDQIRVSPNFSFTFGVRWDWQNQLHDDDNFAPRASVAYALGRNRNTVLRAGGGVFYDRTSSRPLGSLAEYAAPALHSIQILDPAFPNPFFAGIAPSLQPDNLFRFNPAIRTPYLGLYSISLEHKLLKSATISATYRGMVGVSLFESLNVNQPLPPTYVERPHPEYGVFQEVQSSGRQAGQALDLSFSGKASKFFSGLAQYTLSRTNNNTSGINYMPPNSYNLSGEYGRADFDQRQRFNALISSEPLQWMTFGLGITAASGMPYTETLGLDVYHSGLVNARPPGVSRNTLQGPGFFEFDLRWSHDFYLSKKLEKGPRFTLAVDAFNLINRVNYSQYIGDEQSPFYGRAVSALPARRLQFTLRLKF